MNSYNSKTIKIVVDSEKKSSINRLALPTDARFGHIECHWVYLWCVHIMVSLAPLLVYANLFPNNWFDWSDIQYMQYQLRTFPATIQKKKLHSVNDKNPTILATKKTYSFFFDHFAHFRHCYWPFSYFKITPLLDQW